MFTSDAQKQSVLLHCSKKLFVMEPLAASYSKSHIGIVEIGRGVCVLYRSGSCLSEGYQSLSRMFVLLGRCQKQLTAEIHLTIRKGVVYGSKSY